MIAITSGLFEVEILADSFVRVDKELNPDGYHRITTIRIVFPRIVLAELNTHRLLSRNSASSRAIPFRNMQQRVIDNPFIPNRFPKTHTGMQASEWIEAENPDYQILVDNWLWARDMAVDVATALEWLGISKQLVNRFLEPVLMHEVIVTATEWENFFALRADDAAQNEIRIIAELMLRAMNESTPVELIPGQWHVPFGDQFDEERMRITLQSLTNEEIIVESVNELGRMIAVARCARISYLNYTGKDDYVADAKLYLRLKESGHMSPFEHVAQAMTSTQYREYTQTAPGLVEFGWCGNFRGFIQLRRKFPRDTENRRDTRLKPLEI